MADLTIQVADGQLVYDECGAGEPVVLLHGFSFDRTMWNPQIAALARRYRVIRYDLRGFGASARPGGAYSHADDLETLIGTLGLRSPLLVGLSLGANVALEFAARWPSIPRGLVLASPGLAAHRWSQERPPEGAARIAAAQGVAAARAFWLDHPIYASLRATPAQAALALLVQRYDGWHWQHADPRRPAIDLAPLLPTIATPTLVVSGTMDAADYRAIAERIAGELPAARLVGMEGAGHLTNLEQPANFNAAVLAFADQLGDEIDAAHQQSRLGWQG